MKLLVVLTLITTLIIVLAEISNCLTVVNMRNVLSVTWNGKELPRGSGPSELQILLQSEPKHTESHDNLRHHPRSRHHHQRKDQRKLQKDTMRQQSRSKLHQSRRKGHRKGSKKRYYHRHRA